MTNMVIPFCEEKCDICKVSDYIFDRKTGEIVCRNCGFVLQEERAIDTSGGTKQTYHERTQFLSPLGAFVCFENKDFKKRKFTSKERLRADKLRKMSFYHYGDKKMSKLTAWLNICLSKIEASRDLRHEALSMLHFVINDSEEKDYRYNDLGALIPAIVHIAAKLRSFPISFEEIVRASDVDKKKIAYTCRLIIRNLNIKISLGPKEYILFLKRHIIKISRDLKLSAKIQNYSFDILDKVKKRRNLSGIDPKGLVAGIIYVACSKSNEKRSQRQVAAASYTTEVTLRLRKNEIILLV